MSPDRADRPAGGCAALARRSLRPCTLWPRQGRSLGRRAGEDRIRTHQGVPVLGGRRSHGVAAGGRPDRRQRRGQVQLHPLLRDAGLDAAPPAARRIRRAARRRPRPAVPRRRGHAAHGRANQAGVPRSLERLPLHARPRVARSAVLRRRGRQVRGRRLPRRAGLAVRRERPRGGRSPAGRAERGFRRRGACGVADRPAARGTAPPTGSTTRPAAPPSGRRGRRKTATGCARTAATSGPCCTGWSGTTPGASI